MIPDHFIYISSPVIQSVPVRDNGEELVWLYDYAGERNSKIRTQKDVRVRLGVADKVINAQQYLPEGVYLYVIEGYRSPERQAQLYEYQKGVLQERHPDWDDDQISAEAAKLYSPPGSVMPHAAGAAVDLTLVDDKNKILDLGTQINEDAEATEKRTYTLTKGLNQEQMKNRMMLIEAMNYGQFTNYATEWWHWSSGDQYWAFSNRQPFAVYGTIEDPLKNANKQSNE